MILETPRQSTTEPQLPQGLADDEVSQQREAGLGNGMRERYGTSYWTIARRNLLSFINITFISLGLTLIALGRPKDALLVSMLAIASAMIGFIQEAVAKRRLDNIALEARVNPTVRRNGQDQEVSPEELVVGDVVQLRVGDQVPLDGHLVVGNALRLDQSLLTGESDAVAKRPDDEVFSGSVVVNGDGYYEVEKVGSESLMATISAQARTAKTHKTPLQQQVNRIIHMLITVAIGLLIIVFAQDALFWHSSLEEKVTAAAIILGIVPPGLFVMISVTYSTAAARLAVKRALAQQINAIESLSYVDLFCMDKTGTLTTNRLELVHFKPVGDFPESELKRTLGAFAVSVPGGNKTSQAISDALPSDGVSTQRVVPFDSARQWSGMSSDASAASGTFVLGSPEILTAAVEGEPGGSPETWRESGLRVLCFAASEEILSLEDEEGVPRLPDGLRLVAWIALRDELRTGLGGAMDALRTSGVDLKVISGDNPDTVAALARQAGLADAMEAVGGGKLEELSDHEFDRRVSKASVFGRVSPQLKERIVGSLRDQKYHVAMTGDGVNDIPSLKKADVGIAMESGSQATRAAADIVLLDDSFTAVPTAIGEGQRIRRGLQKTFYLFLSRVFSVAIVVLMTTIFHLGFPFLPGHMTLLTLLTVGIPTFALAFFSSPGSIQQRPMRALIRFVVPATVMTALAAFTVYALVYVVHDVGFRIVGIAEAVRGFLFVEANMLSRDALTWALVLCGLWLIVYAAPPVRWFAVAEPLDRDWRPVLTAIAMLPLYLLVLSVPMLREFLELTPLPMSLTVSVAVVTSVWMLGLRYVWSSGLADRYFVDTVVGRSIVEYLESGSPRQLVAKSAVVNDLRNARDSIKRKVKV